MEEIAEDRSQSSKSLRSRSKSKQQPGQYLCVDTREKLESGEIQPYRQTHRSLSPQIKSNGGNKGFYKYPIKKESPAAIHGTSVVQPDSLCKLKTVLAVEYVRNILETSHIPVPVKKLDSLKNGKKRGQLKPLISVKQLDKPKITSCLGIQNTQVRQNLKSIFLASRRRDTRFQFHKCWYPHWIPSKKSWYDTDRRKKTFVVDDRRGFLIETLSPESTRFSSANKTILGKDKDVDLRKLSLVSQNSSEMDQKPFSIKLHSEVESNNCEQVQERSFEFDGFINDQQFRGNNETDDYDRFGGDIDDVVENDHTIIDKKMDFDRENYRKDQKEIIYHIDHENSCHENNLTENEKGIHQNFERRNPDGCTNKNKNIFTPVENSVKPNHADMDNIHVKDIWKALVNSGYEISREEVSKYKVNTTRSPTRIKSAPTRRRSSQDNYLSKDISRTRSAFDGKDCQKGGSSEDISGKSDDVEEGYTADEVSDGASKRLFADGNSREKVGKNLSCRENIEVVAQKKSFSKLPRPKNIRRPLVAPLNFKINTRPKLGHFFYFAYGLNMNYKRLDIQLRCRTGERYWGLLFGFKLLFNKKGSSEGGVGFPNIVAEPGFSVEGCVYELPQARLLLLDTSVGFPKHYARLVLPVWLCNSMNPDDLGVAQYCVPAVVYVAQNDWVVSDPMTLDNSFTFKQCLLGTDLLTPNYNDFLSSLAKQI